MASKTTLLSAIGLVVAISFASTSLGQNSTYEVLEKWVSFEPAISQAVTAQPCTGAMLVGSKAVRIKVGQPYMLVDYDIGAKIGWTGELIWNPNRAVAKRTFEIYDLAEIDSKQWKLLGETFAGSPVSVAFVSPSSDGYVATPVKWNASLAKVFHAAYVVAEKVNDQKKGIVKAMAGEILSMGTMSAKPLVPGSSPPGFQFIEHDAQLDLAMGAVAAYDCGDVDAVMDLVPVADIFIGISETPKGFTVDPIAEVITESGYWGQPLGTVMPSWPSKDD